MYKREELIKSISDNLAILETSIRNRNINKLYDINELSENFMAEFLNIIYSYKLTNVNEIKDNQAAIDLGDKINKIAFQVTSTNTTKKIQHTINGFVKDDNLTKKYDSLQVFIISKKQKQVYGTIDKKGIKFDKKDVLDFSDIIKEIKKSTLALTKLQSAKDFLDSELTVLKLSLTQQIPDDIALKKLHRLVDRRALQDNFHREKSMYDFYNAFNQIIEFINKGSVALNYDGNNKSTEKSELIKGKARFEFENKEYRQILNKIYAKLIEISDLYVECVQNGDINPDGNHFAFFRDPRTPDKFNKLRTELVSELNKLFKKSGLATISTRY